VIAFTESSNAHVDVMDASVVMDEHDVIVEQENVDHKHAELHKEGHEIADEATLRRLLVVVV